MRKYIFSALILIVLVTFVFFQLKKTTQSAFSNYKIIDYKLNNKNLHLLVADNQQKWKRGLMNVKKLEQGIDGMIYIFPQKAKRSFWNKNTSMDTELYWLVGDKIIGKDYLPAIKEDGKTSASGFPQEVDKVIEIPR